MDTPIEESKRISRRKGKANMKVGTIKHTKAKAGITEGQFDEVLKRVIRKPSETPSDLAKSGT